MRNISLRFIESPCYYPNLPIIRETENGLSFQIICGGEGFTKASKTPYAHRGVSSNFVSSLWIIMDRDE